VIPKTLLRRLLLALASVLIVGLIVAPLTLLWAALYTESGAQFVVRHLPHHLGPVDLEITGLTGTVAHGLHVERVEIDHELVHLTFTNLNGRVRLAPLLVQTIRVTYASVEGAEVQVKRRVHPPTPSPPSFLPRWLKISADEAHVKRADLSVYNGFKMQVTDITADALLRHLDMRFFQAEGLLEGAHFILMGDLLATDPLGFRVKGHLDWHPPGQPAYVVGGSARGDLNILNVVAQLAGDVGAERALRARPRESLPLGGERAGAAVRARRLGRLRTPRHDHRPPDGRRGCRYVQRPGHG
jgi:hypothetical protein